MSNARLSRFVERIMTIEPGYAGMGGAGAGIVGAAGTHDQVIASLRGHAMAFVAEYTKQESGKRRLTKASQQLEGSLYSVKLISGISDDTFEELVTELHRLLKIAAQKHY